MDHAEVRERLESALLSPTKLQSLDADATPAGEALRAHVATCAACARELRALRETAALLAAAAPDDLVPPPEARDAVLRRIRETGVARAARSGRPEVRAIPTRMSASTRLAAAWRRLVAGSPLALAAALVLLVLGTALLGGLAAARDVSDREARELAAVAAATDRLLREPDSKKAVLRDLAGNAAGSVLYSPAMHQLVVISDALARPAEGEQYDCYVAHSGNRRKIGWMHFADGLAYWAGRVDPLTATSGAEMLFIVTRAGQDVLQGEL
jgi:hypothetical protein